MAKKMNEAEIANELEEASVFFKKNSSSPLLAKTKKPPAADPQDDRTDERSNERSIERTVPHTNNRQIVRHSFDIYQDQLLQLHTIQLEAVRSGKKKLKLGELVRMALDQYFKTERTNVRMNETSNLPSNEHI